MRPLSRRAVLRGLGTVVALPALEAMLPRARAEEPAARRYVLCFGPNGAVMPAWTPTDTGPGYVAPPSLAPLAPVRDHVLVISGVDNVPGTPNHAFRTRSLLSERLEDAPWGPRFGRSLDQALAAHLSPRGAFPSLQLASEGATACGTLECGHLYSVSWAGEGTPLPRHVHPRTVFDQLFGDADPLETEAARQLRLRRHRSVLDAVLEDAHALQAVLGSADRQRLEAYLSGVRALEQSLDAPPPPPGTCATGPVLAPGQDVELLVSQMMDLLVLALECDRTRVITWMIGSAESYRPLAFLGLGGDHHTASHHYPAAHEAMTTWMVGRYAALVARLAAITGPTGRSLLDDTFVVYASGLSSGPDHDWRDLPLLLAGRGGGGVTLGQHVRLPAGTPLASVALAIAQGLAAPLTRFGLDGAEPALDLR